MEPRPFLPAFPRMVPTGVPAAPGIPDVHAVSLDLQGHPHVHPLLVIQFSRFYMIQDLQQVILVMFHVLLLLISLVYTSRGPHPEAPLSIPLLQSGRSYACLLQSSRYPHGGTRIFPGTGSVSGL